MYYAIVSQDVDNSLPLRKQARPAHIERLKALTEAGASYERFQVPGAFEIPAAIGMAADGGGRPFDGYVALGCVIRGETSHYDYVCGESARALQDLAKGRGLAIGYGILTVENRDQAVERAAPGRRNKGGEAAAACLSMIALKRRLGSR